MRDLGRVAEWGRDIRPCRSPTTASSRPFFSELLGAVRSRPPPRCFPPLPATPCLPRGTVEGSRARPCIGGGAHGGDTLQPIVTQVWWNDRGQKLRQIDADRIRVQAIGSGGLSVDKVIKNRGC